MLKLIMILASLGVVFSLYANDLDGKIFIAKDVIKNNVIFFFQSFSEQKLITTAFLSNKNNVLINTEKNDEEEVLCIYSDPPEVTVLYTGTTFWIDNAEIIQSARRDYTNNINKNVL